MGYQTGRSALFKMGSQSSPETYTTMGGLRNCDTNVESGAVDVTNKDSNGYQEMLPGAGVWKMDVTAQGLFKDDAPTRAVIAAGNVPQAIINAQLVFGNGDTWTGNWVVKTWKRTGTYQDAETYDIALSSTGQMVFNGGA